MKSGTRRKAGILAGALLAGSCFGTAQDAQPPAGQPVVEAPAYKPRFAGDPAHSEAEAGALGYIRTVLMAQKLYNKKHDSFATSLPGLVHSGSFTQRMVKTDRGDYFVNFHSEGKGTGFSVSLVPKQYDAAHRAFFADDSGVIRAETDKEATENSPKVK